MKIELNDYINLIRSQAWKCKSKLFKGMWDFEDLEQEGIRVFYVCKRSYEEGRSKFSTWLYLNLRSCYAEIVKKENKLDNAVDEIVRDVKEVFAIEDLSESAKDLLGVIFSMPEPLKDLIDRADLYKERVNCKRKLGVPTRKLLCEYFSWNFRKIKEVEKEIRQCYCF